MGDDVRAVVYEAGGDEADISELIQESFRDFNASIGPYLLAGLGQFAVMVPVVVMTVGLVYVGSLIGVAGGWALGMLLLFVAIALFGEGIGTLLGMLAMVALPFIGFLVVFLPILPVMVAIFAPINASLVRAVAAHQRGEKEMTLASSFDTVFQDLGRVVFTGLILTFLTLVGLLFCNVGALAIPVLFGFVNTLVILHNRGPLEAIQIQLAHFRKHTGLHLMVGLLQLAMGMAAGFVPVLGPMFLLDLQVRAHRKLFGDGPEPVL